MLVKLYFRPKIVVKQTYILLANVSTYIRLVSHLQVNSTNVLLCLIMVSQRIISFPVY